MISKVETKKNGLKKDSNLVAKTPSDEFLNVFDYILPPLLRHLCWLNLPYNRIRCLLCKKPTFNRNI